MNSRKIISFHKAASDRQNNRSRIASGLPWPENLFSEIGIREEFTDHGRWVFSEDQMDGLIYVLDQLKERERVMIYYRYLEYMTFQEIKDCLHISKTSIREIIRRCIITMQRPIYLDYYRNGLQETVKMRIQQRKLIQTTENIEEKILLLKEISIDKADFSKRMRKALGSRKDLRSLGDIVEMLEKEPGELITVRGVGEKAVREIVLKLEEYYVDCSKARECYQFLDTKEDETKIVSIIR